MLNLREIRKVIEIFKKENKNITKDTESMIQGNLKEIAEISSNTIKVGKKKERD